MLRQPEVSSHPSRLDAPLAPTLANVREVVDSGLAASAVLVDCQRRSVAPPPAASSVGAALGSARAPSPCYLGTVDACTSCSDRCETGICHAGRCEKLPEPFATVTSATAFTGSGFLSASERVFLIEPGRREATSATFVPYAVFDGRYYGVARDTLVSADGLDGTPVPVLPKLRASVRWPRSIAADASGVYFISDASICAVRNGTLTIMNVHLEPDSNIGDIALGSTSVFWAEHPRWDRLEVFGSPGRQRPPVSQLGRLKAIEKDGKRPRLLATGFRISAVATVGRWLYFSSGDTIQCTPQVGGPTRAVARLPGLSHTSVVCLGATEKHLYVAALISGDYGHALFQIPRPDCAPARRNSQGGQHNTNLDD